MQQRATRPLDESPVADAVRRSRRGVRSALIGLALATVTAAMIFSLWPNLDRSTAALFYDASGHFIARGSTVNLLRRIGDILPIALCAALVIAYALRRLGVRGVPAPGTRGLAVVVIGFLLGPGLLVNVGLKEHAHRPRPGQTLEFGGKSAFRPFYRFDGACRSNCSFVSGEVSTAAWTLGPALLAPPAWRPLAIAASLLLTAVMAILRVAAGGHFLSDVLFAALFTAIVVLALYALIFGWAGRRGASLARRSLATIVPRAGRPRR